MLPRIIAGIVIIAAASLSFIAHRPPKAKPLHAPETSVSGLRAMQYVNNIAHESRPAGSAAHDRAADYIMAVIHSNGLTPTIQETLMTDDAGKAFYLRNIVAVRRGTNRTAHSVCLAAHYDSVPFGPGASDDAAGCAVLLETMRSLSHTNAFAFDVIYLFTDGEEGYNQGSGTRGALAFVNNHPLMTNLGYVLNYDCRGSHGPVYMYETGLSNAHVVRMLAASGAPAFTSSLMASIYKSMPLGSDFTRFMKKGVPGWNFAYTSGLAQYHTARDTVENLSPDSVEHALQYTSAILRQLENPAVSSRDGSEIHYFDVLGKKVIIYPAAAAPALTIAGLIALLTLLYLARKRIGMGFFSALLRQLGSLLAVTAAVLLLAAAVYFFRNVYIVYLNPLLSPLLYLTALGIFLLLWKPGLADEAASAVIWAIFSVVVLFVMPGGHYLFIWPFIGALILFAAGIVFKEKTPQIELAIRAIVAALVIVLWSGTILSFYETLTALFAFITAGVFCLVAGFVLPLVSGERIRKYGAYACIIVGVLGPAGVSMMFRFTKAEPQFTSLVYALDRDATNAIWYSAAEKTDEWTKRVIPADGTKRTAERFIPAYTDVFLSAAAPICSLPSFSMPYTVSGKTVRAVLNYRSAYSYIVLFAEQTNIISVSLDGKKLPRKDNQFLLRINGKPRHDPVLTIRAASFPLRITAVAHQYALPADAGLTPMPEHMMMLCNTPDFNRRPLKSGETLVRQTFVFTGR
ncbi:MAG: M28 family peptidase [Spirochaetes bacterium]|nr:M28 family peptidase [Spirochaetota bacterium]